MGILAEEGGYGKVRLLNQGAYEDMDVCLMYGGVSPHSCRLLKLSYNRCHPAPGPPSSASLSSSLAITPISVEYRGHT